MPGCPGTRPTGSWWSPGWYCCSPPPIVGGFGIFSWPARYGAGAEYGGGMPVHHHTSYINIQYSYGQKYILAHAFAHTASMHPVRAFTRMGAWARISETDGSLSDKVAKDKTSRWKARMRQCVQCAPVCILTLAVAFILMVTWLDFFRILSFYAIRKFEWAGWRHCRNRVTWLSSFERFRCVFSAWHIRQPFPHYFSSIIRVISV